MAEFRFRLEAVLRQRLAAERTRQLAVAAIERERVAVEDEIRAYQREVEREREELRERLAGGGGDERGRIDLRAVRFQVGAGLRLLARAQAAAIRLAGVHKRLDTARLDLLAAATRRKAVEILRDRMFEEWRGAARRRDDAALDELAVMGAARAAAAEAQEA